MDSRSLNEGLDERWFEPGGVVPVDVPTTGALVREILRLRSELDLREKQWKSIKWCATGCSEDKPKTSGEAAGGPAFGGFGGFL